MTLKYIYILNSLTDIPTAGNEVLVTCTKEAPVFARKLCTYSNLGAMKYMGEKRLGKQFFNNVEPYQLSIIYDIREWPNLFLPILLNTLHLTNLKAPSIYVECSYEN